jgi:hypothetical protein
MAFAAAVVACSPGCKKKYTPPPSKTAPMDVVHPAPAFDVWGRGITAEEAEALLPTPAGRQMLSPGAGAVKIDEKLLRLGETAFYEETFGNEVP